MAPLVTIVTVTYNSSEFVREAIDSILASTYTNFELIIGDDNSTDSTWDIIETYKDSRIKKYRNEINLGEYPNRNKAINMAKGEYLIFIDGDDMIYPHGLKFMTEMLHSFPDCGMALMRWWQSNVFYPIKISPKDFYIGQYFGHGFLGTSFANTFFRTQVLKENGGLSLKYRGGDDYIRYRIAQRDNVLIIPDQLTWWRETPGQASQILSNSLEGIVEGFNLKLEFLDENCPLPEEDRKKARDNVRYALAKLILKNTVKLKFRDAIHLMKNFNIPLKYLFDPFRNPVKIDPLDSYTAVRPKRENKNLIRFLTE